MSDFIKTIIAIFITSVLSSIATTERLSVEIVNIKSSVDKIEVKVDKIDEHQRLSDLRQAQYQAQYLAAN